MAKVKETIYISGKITESKFYKLHFMLVSAKLNILGYKVYNPVKICSRMPKWTIHDEYMHICLEVLTMADSIYMMRGWEDSKGANLELEKAEKRGTKIYHWDMFDMRR